MRNVGRPDIYSLHGRRGVRAATWYDSETEVCWLLGVVKQHNYAEFEARAANNELLPDEDDYAVFFQESQSFDGLVQQGVQKMLAAAIAAPQFPQRAALGGLVKTEVTVVLEWIDFSQIADIFIAVRLPPLPRHSAEPSGWPGKHLVERLAELALGADFETLDCRTPLHIPIGSQKWRILDPAKEIALVVCNVDLEQYGLASVTDRE